MNKNKLCGVLAVLCALSFVHPVKAGAPSSVSKNFNTAAGVSSSLPVPGGKSFTYTAVGAASTSTIVLEVSRDGSNFGPVNPDLTITSVAGVIASVSGTIQSPFPGGSTAFYRFRCSSYTAGSSTVTLAAANNLLPNSRLSTYGDSVVDYYDQGVAVTGYLTATGGAIKVSSSATSNFPASFRGAYTSGQLQVLSANPGDIAINLSLTPPALVISSATTTALTGAWILPPSTSTTVVPIRAD